MVLGHLEKARKLYREEMAVRDSFSPAKANDWEARREFAGLLTELGTLTVKLGDLDEGQKLYDQCAKIRRQISEEKPDFWPAENDLALSYNNQGSVYFPLRGDPKKAREFHLKSLDVLKKPCPGRSDELRKSSRRWDRRSISKRRAPFIPATKLGRPRGMANA